MNIKELIGTLTDQEVELVLVNRRMKLVECLREDQARLDALEEALDVIRGASPPPVAAEPRKRKGPGRRTSKAARAPKGKGKATAAKAEKSAGMPLKEALRRLLENETTPQTTGQITDRLAAAMRKEFGGLERSVLYARVSVALASNRDLFASMGQRKGYVLAGSQAKTPDAAPKATPAPKPPATLLKSILAVMAEPTAPRAMLPTEIAAAVKSRYPEAYQPMALNVLADHVGNELARNRKLFGASDGQWCLTADGQRAAGEG